MNRPCSIALCVLFGLRLTMASTIAPADPAPQLLRQVTIPPPASYGGPDDGRPVKPDSLQPIYWYSLPLRHITQKLLFSEMDQAYVPNADTVVLKPGETLHYPFRIEGLKAVIPGPTNHMLLVRATPSAFGIFRDLWNYLDIPKSRAMQSLPSGRERKNGTRQNAGLTPTASQRPLCQSDPGTPAAPEVGGPEVMERMDPRKYFLTHATPLALLGKLRHAYVPDGGAVVLKPGEALRSSFSLEGVRIIFPNIQDNSLLVYAKGDGSDSVRQLFKTMDVPDTPVPMDVYSTGTMTTVTP